MAVDVIRIQRSFAMPVASGVKREWREYWTGSRGCAEGLEQAVALPDSASDC